MGANVIAQWMVREMSIVVYGATTHVSRLFGAVVCLVLVEDTLYCMKCYNTNL